MRHRVKAKHFNRDTKARKAMFKNMLISLFEHGMVETTEARAKQIKRLADKLIYRAKPGTLQARRVLERFFGSKQAVNTLVDSVAPAMEDRNSGFTRITKLGRRRGDDAAMVIVELVEQPLARSEKAPAKEKKSETKAESKDDAQSEKKTSAKSETKKSTSAKKSSAKKADKKVEDKAESGDQE